ncbi:hypothetical protein ABT160_18715 [Streptomyces sp. NPDC001941]|uniref:hypothetical protein n=1 Tax=Streptomyces sp. NPDC001941 TaxID=3154659 RepID=UPI00332F88D8
MSHAGVLQAGVSPGVLTVGVVVSVAVAALMAKALDLAVRRRSWVAGRWGPWAWLELLGLCVSTAVVTVALRRPFSVGITDEVWVSCLHGLQGPGAGRQLGELTARVQVLPLSYGCEWASGAHAQVMPSWAAPCHFAVMAAAASLVVFARPLVRWWSSGTGEEPTWDVLVVEDPWPQDPRAAGTERLEAPDPHRRPPHPH